MDDFIPGQARQVFDVKFSPVNNSSYRLRQDFKTAPVEKDAIVQRKG
jgi:hypothetical protein